MFSSSSSSSSLIITNVHHLFIILIGIAIIKINNIVLKVNAAALLLLRLPLPATFHKFPWMSSWTVVLSWRSPGHVASKLEQHLIISLEKAVSQLNASLPSGRFRHRRSAMASKCCVWAVSYQELCWMYAKRQLHLDSGAIVRSVQVINKNVMISCR